MPFDASLVRLFVVIPVHNRREHTRQCLTYLRAQTWRDFQAIVVDDGSSDGTSEMVRSEFPETLLLSGDGSLWWSGATNLGIREALERNATHVLCLNDDTCPPPNFLCSLLDTANQLPRAVVGAAAADVHTGELCFAGERVNWLTAGNTSVLPEGTEERIADVTHAPGRGLLIPSDVFREIGLFDEENFPQYAADYDFTHRARKAGRRVVCDRSAVLGCYPEASGGSAFRRRKSWKNYRNHLFHIRSDANLRVFFRYALRNCPPLALPLCLTAGIARRVGGYLRDWIRQAWSAKPDAARELRIAFVTNFAPHYRVGMFEALSRLCSLRCFFHSDGGEWYWQPEHGVSRGAFAGHYLHGFWLGRMRIVPGLLPALLFGRYDVIVKCINDRFSLPVSYLAARSRRVPFVLWTGIWCRVQTPAQKLLLPVTQYLYRHADAVVVYGDHVRRYLISEGVDPRRIFLAPQAVDNAACGRVVSANEQQELLAQLEIPARTKVLLYVGRLEEIKGLEFLLDGFAEAEAEGAVLILCGTGSLAEALRARAQALGVESRVVFTGYVRPAELVRYYSIAWVVILPSITTPAGREAWGLVANEAFNQGVPMIATEVVGAAAGHLVRDLRNGLVVPEQDAHALGEAIGRVVSEPGLRDTLAERARQDIADWTQQRMAEGFLDAARYAVALKQGAGS